ncbi:MAG TPA: histidine kinase [Peptococcaceae bacterium]|nr:MAG: Diguanylate cyclase and metal dependent phosphohydrolase [Clostridia bacterium 41_269]HBT20641.1 histidine kinase [Peptococcaceae bacterium]
MKGFSFTPFTLISAIKSIDRSFLNSYYIPEFKEKDELSVLSNEVKNLLERLETYQREIEDKERKYSTVVENSAEAIFVTQNKIIRYANPAASKLLGVAKEELISRSLEDFVFADDLEKKKKHVVDLINKGKKVIYGFDFRLKAADGSIKWVEGSLVLIDWDGSDAVLYFLNDVTYRKIMEEEYQRLLDEKNLVLDGIEELVLFIDRDMRIITANKKACEVAGRSREEIFGGKCYELIPKGKEICKSCPVLEAIWTKKVAAGEIYSADGRIWSAKATPVKDKNGKVTGAVEVLLDITDKKKYEERLKHMSMYDSLTGLYNRAYFEEEINRLSLMKGKFPAAILIADMDGLKEINDSMGHSKGDEMLKICADLLKGVLRSSDVLARIGGDEFAAVLPGVDEEKAQKIVQRVYDAVDRYNEKHQEIPLSISVGIAVQERENEPLEETFKKADDLMYQNKLLKQSSSRSHVVRALLAALKEKDFISAGHAKRLEEYCVKMGQKMGLSFEKIADLSLLAQVHDLGKVVIPDEILFKKGPLSEEEWEIMRQHPVRGSRIALSSPDLAGIADLILKHHERWDGKGYPLGLKGEDIPIECRILAVADAFDAMTNDRPYRRAMKKEEALKEIKNEAGKQFDPQVVEVFLSMFTGKDDKEVINLNEKRAN